MGNESTYLAGKLLLAMPAMGDPRFHRAVIFMCAHDANGAMGLVINHTLAGIEFSHLLEQLGMASDIKVPLGPENVPVMSGGPVEGARGFILHTRDFSQKDTIYVGDAYSVTGTVEALREVAQGNGPDQLLFILGYAGWGAGQLEQELQQNSWLVVDPDPSLIFHADPEEKWSLAVGKLGFDPAMLSVQAGRA
jgi:putative transcriptional regulator